MKRIFVFGAIGAAMLLSGCTDKDGARDTLQKNGYTDITVGGYSFFTCAENETFATEFSARSPSGDMVTGAVCSGWFKGKTIRFD